MKAFPMISALLISALASVSFAGSNSASTINPTASSCLCATEGPDEWVEGLNVVYTNRVTGALETKLLATYHASNGGEALKACEVGVATLVRSNVCPTGSLKGASVCSLSATLAGREDGESHGEYATITGDMIGSVQYAGPGASNRALIALDLLKKQGKCL